MPVFPRLEPTLPRRAFPSLLAVLSALLWMAPVELTAQAHPTGMANVLYDPSIPTPEEVLGHDPFERITGPEAIVAYFEELARAAPSRAHLVQYAKSWQGRPLVLLAIGSTDRMARPSEVQDGLAALADPRELSTEARDELVAQLPVVTALAHSVHGNEITPAGSSMIMAYHLLAAQNDPEVDRILEESIVLLDPVQNPDGRARFLAENLQGAAMDPDPDPVAAERDHPWPGARSNHYLFDLNRDWFAQTQVETRGKVQELLRWNPHIVVDLHEMGSNSTYYFPPSARPGNPHTTSAQDDLFELFGRENANLFDERGWPYFIREIFDGFYPGYGASWPTAHGALGKTFEQASPRGLLVRRDEGDTLSYAQGVEQNFQAALRTALTAAENREEILGSFLDFRLEAVAEGGSGIRAYLLPPGDDPGRTRDLASLLASNGIEVRRAREPFSVGGRSYPAGSFVVPLEQPAGRLVRNLMDPETTMDPGFVELQRERRAQRLPDQIYDVTAWSLPLLWDVETVAADVPVAVEWDEVPAGFDRDRGEGPPSPLPEARVGWLLPWGTGTAALTGQGLDQGLPLRAAGAPFSLNGERFGVGTILVRASELDTAHEEILADLISKHRAPVTPVDDAFVAEGISLGSNQMRQLPKGRTLLVWDTPTQSLSAGWARWVLERRYGKQVTAVRAGALGRADLSGVSVLILPQGNYAQVLSGPTLERIRAWVREGGTLVTMGESTRWATREEVGLLSSRAELRAGAPSRDPAPSPSLESQPIDLLEAIVPQEESPEPVSGAILRAVLDTTHVLAAGSGGEMGAMVSGSRIFSPLTLDQGTNVGVYAPLGELVLSGIVWEDARPQLASKAFLMHEPMGRGRVVAFAEDPNFRGYAEATQLLFMNAVLLAPAF